MTVWVCVTAGIPAATLTARGTRPAGRGTPRIPTARLGRHDEAAVALAVTLAGALGDRAAAVTVGGSRAETALRAALALGCGRALRIDAEPEAPAVVAGLLADLVRSEGSPTMVLTGIRGSQWETGQVPGLLACRLDVPCVAGVSAVEAAGDGFAAHWEGGGGHDQAPIAAGSVVSVARCLANRPAVPSIHATTAAFTTDVAVVTPGPPAGPPTPPEPVLVGTRIESVETDRIRFGPGELEQAAAEVAERLLRHYGGR
jgi:electron transfer flavoprotein alpha/beta subunit